MVLVKAAAGEGGRALKSRQYQALIFSTAAFTICFAVWTLFSIVGIKIKQEMNLDDSEFGLLVATPVLTGALSRLFLGLLSDRFGGRRVFALLMLLTAAAVYAVSAVSRFPLFLLAALGLGFSGGAFAIGVSYVSNWFDRAQQGTALGIFGAGTIGTAVTTFGAPLLVDALGWRETVQIYAAALAISAAAFYLLTSEDPVITQFVNGAKEGPIGMSEEKDKALAGTLNQTPTSGWDGNRPLAFVNQLEPSPGLPPRAAAARRKQRVIQTLHTLPPNAQRAILESLSPAERARAQHYAQGQPVGAGAPVPPPTFPDGFRAVR